jgi:hemoglobin-like flavoprotein
VKLHLAVVASHFVDEQIDSYMFSTFSLLRLVNLDPKVKKIFGFADGEDIRANPCYVMHAKATVERLDMAVCLLGPDLEPLEEDLRDLGERHLSYGVQPKNLPFMAKSLIGAIEKVLKDEFSAEDKKGWDAVLGFMVESMTMGMKATN